MYNPPLLNSGQAFDDELGDECLALLGSSYCEEVIENTLRGDAKRARAHLCEMQMARIAQGSAKVEHRIDEEGLGVPDFRTCKLAYHAWAFKFGKWEGNKWVPQYDCWDDDEFVRDMKRGNPEMRVRIAKRTNFVGWTPSGAAGTARPTRGGAPQASRSITLTDRRGNAA